MAVHRVGRNLHVADSGTNFDVRLPTAASDLSSVRRGLEINPIG
jgi:hypothetical protein